MQMSFRDVSNIMYIWYNLMSLYIKHDEEENTPTIHYFSTLDLREWGYAPVNYSFPHIFVDLYLVMYLVIWHADICKGYIQIPHAVCLFYVVGVHCLTSKRQASKHCSEFPTPWWRNEQKEEWIIWNVPISLDVDGKQRIRGSSTWLRTI